jgi:hypothetical protein
VNTSRTPWLESWAARLGVAVLVALSATVGYHSWQGRGEEQLAILTVGAELVAFAGLAVTRFHWPHSKWIAAGGLLATALSAAWCGFTMYQAINDESRARALALATERPAYVFAKDAADDAAAALHAQIRQPRPACTCPDTIGAWEDAQSIAIARLSDERDAAVQKLEAALPPIRTDVGAIIRGVGVETVKLLGFAVFGLATAPNDQRRPRPAPKKDRARRPGLWAWVRAALGIAAVAATPAAALPPATPAAVSETTPTPTRNVSSVPRAAETGPKAVPTPRARPRPPTAEELASAVKVLSARKERVSVRNVAAVLGVPHTRVQRAPAWRAKWASA